MICWTTTSGTGNSVFDLWIDRKMLVLLKICIAVLIGAPFLKLVFGIVMKYREEKG